MTDFANIIESQRKFFATGQSRNENFRKRNLEKLKNAMDSYRDQIVSALKKDLNKSEFESHMSEFLFVYVEIKFAQKNLIDWMKKKREITPMTAMPAKSYTLYEPMGLTLIISPWNYPVMLSLDPLVASIAAGNTSIIKLSRKVSNTARVLRQMINTTFPSDYIYFVDNDEVSNDGLLEYRYDHIFFTGSPSVGKKVMEKASKNLTKVTLELGGKSPCIVDKSADIKLSAKRIMWGKLLNSGQTCVAPDYIIVHKDIKDDLIKELKNFALEFFGPSPIENEDYPRIIDKKAYLRLMNLLKDQDIYFGGRGDIEKLKIEPTIVDGVDFSNKLMAEEIFGPILPILVYDDLFELIKILKMKEKPLAQYVFSLDQTVIDRLVNDLSYGSCCINDVVMQITSPYLEFGGVGNSGMGGYHGYYGFMNFSNRKAIMDRKTGLDVNLRYAPYQNGQEVIVKLLEK